MKRFLRYVYIHRKPREIFIALFLIGSLFLQYTVPVFAVSESQQNVWNLGIEAFDVDVSCATQSVTGALPTGPGLSQADVDNITKLQPDYERASAATGVPWQALAAIHYREGSNNPTQDLQAGNPIGTGGGQFAEYPKGIPQSIEQSAIFAAEHLIEKAAQGVVKKPVNVPSPEPDAMKDALFGYNGRAKVYAQQAATLGFDPGTQPFEGSPYVMNNYDATHTDMKIITRDFGGLDGVDKRLGAYTLYMLLLGSSPSTASAANIAAVDSCSSGGQTSSPVDCTGVSGTAKILCAAKAYDPVSYVLGAGHEGPTAWKSKCPTPDASCALDCSSLVSVAVYDAFGVEINQTTWDQVSDTTHWKKISFSELQAGDIVQPDPGHVEIVDYVEGTTIHTFGAHNPNKPQADQVGPTSYMKDGPGYVYMRYVGPQN